MRSNTAARTEMTGRLRAIGLSITLVCTLLCAMLRAQTVSFAGLLASNGKGATRGLVRDASGNLYLLYDQADGVRVCKMNATADVLLASIRLGAAGDAGTGIAIDAGGNLYISGTSTSGSLSGTPGTSFPVRADSSVNSFVAKLGSDLSVQWLSFLGAGKTAATAIATNGNVAVVTGVTYSAGFPVTAAGIQQAPASASSANGFAESFDTVSGVVRYATYLTGANGDTTPSTVAVDSSGAAYIAGSTTATGLPTVNALVPRVLLPAGSSTSGFLMKLSPAGDGFLFSTFVPGNGLTSLDMASDGSLWTSGSIATGLFPVSNAQAPIASTLPYQAALHIAAGGQSVPGGTLLAPGDSSIVRAISSNEVWVAGHLAAKLLPLPAAETFGDAFALHLRSDGSIDRAARFGGLAANNLGYNSLTATANAIVTDNAGDATFGITLLPTLSASLLSTAQFDVLPLKPVTSALTATMRNALPSAPCSGSQCQGGAAMLAGVQLASASSSLVLSTDTSPNLVLRNVSSIDAANVSLQATGFSYSTDCGATLAAGGECNIALSGPGPGSLSVSATNASSITYAIPSVATTSSAIAVSLKEIDFGIVTASSAPRKRTLKITNLSATSQTFASIYDSVVRNWSVAEDASDCTPAGANKKVLAAGASCNITLGLTASSSNDGSIEGQWKIGDRDVFLTGYSQAAQLGVSARSINFGRQFFGGLHLPRFVYLSNPSDSALAHTRIVLPEGSVFTADDSCPSILQPGSVCRVQFDYLATKATDSSSITLALDDGSSLLLQGETVPQPTVGASNVNPNLVVSPSSVSFDSSVVVTGLSSETHSLTIKNTGISSFPLLLSVTGDFLFTTNCAATLAANSACSVILSFAPSTAGIRQGLFTVSDGSSSPVYVDLSGDATAILPASAGMANFGDVAVGVPSVQWFKISQVLTSLTATTSGDFGVVLVEDAGYGHGTPPSSSYAGTATNSCLNCWLGIQFKPTTNGSRSSTVALSSAIGGNASTMQLSGTGVPVTGLLLTPTSVDFGGVMVGSTSLQQVFLLTNATDNDLSLSSVTTDGDFDIDSDYATGSLPCKGTLSAHASCQIAVSFAPLATGGRTGHLNVLSTSASASVLLTGTGAASSGVAFRPGALRFDHVPGIQATQQSVQVVNTGTSTIMVGAASIDNTAFTASSNCGLLAAGSSCDLTVTFVPLPSRQTATLTVPVTTYPGGIASNAIYTIPLSGDYTTEDTSLQIVAEEMNFGAANTLSAGAARIFRVNNLTSHPMTLDIGTPRNFAVTANGCAGLAPNASCTLTAQALPVLHGSITGTLFLTGTPTDGAATVNALAFLEAYGRGSGTLRVSGDINLSGILDFGQVASGQNSSQILTLTNPGATGDPDIHIRRITSGWPFLSTTTCGDTLSPHQSCTVTITYTPLYQLATGTSTSGMQLDQGVVVIESDAANAPALIDLEAHASPAFVTSPENSAPLVALTTSTGGLYFSSTAVGSASAEQIVTLSNTGTQTIHISSTKTSADFHVSTACAQLLPGDGCTLHVTFTPQAPGIRIGTLEILSNASTSLEFISLTGSGAPSTLAVSATQLNYGPLLIGRSATQSVLITNSGSPVTFGSFTTTGDYAVTGGTCSAAGNILATGATCTVDVTFTPLSSGARYGTLSIAASATTLPLQVVLNGTGVQPQLTATPLSLAFGDVATGRSASLSFTIFNRSATSVYGLGLSSNSPVFTAASTCGVSELTAGSSCSVTVTFAPSTAGIQNAVLNVTSSDPASPLAVALTGDGVSSGSFSLAVNGSQSASASVQQGIPATFTLAVTPLSGFTGNVALTCSSATAANLYCSISPSSILLNGSTVSSTVTITTVNASAMRRTIHPWALCLLLPLFYRRRKFCRRFVFVFLGFFLVGCGGNTLNNSDSRIRYADPGTYSFTVTASSTSGIPVTQSVTATVTVTKR